MMSALCALILMALGEGQIQIHWDLMANPSVQRELNLPKATIARINSAVVKARKALIDEDKHHRNAMAMTFESRVLGKALLDLTAIGSRLDPALRFKMQRLTLQSLGPYVWEAEGVPEAIKLTTFQQAEIRRKQDATMVVYEAALNSYIKQRHPKMITLKGGRQVPAPSLSMKNLDATRDRALWRGVKSSITPAQTASLTRLLGEIP